MNDTCEFIQLGQIRRALFFNRLIITKAQRIDELLALGEFKYFGISPDESRIFRPGKPIMTSCLGSSSIIELSHSWYFPRLLRTDSGRCPCRSDFAVRQGNGLPGGTPINGIIESQEKSRKDGKMACGPSLTNKFCILSYLPPSDLDSGQVCRSLDVRKGFPIDG